MVILDKGTADHSCYIKIALPIALKYQNEAFDDKWIFQQDGANPHRDHLGEEWYRDNFPSLIDSDPWSPNNPAFNPLDDSIWVKLISVIDWNKARLKARNTDSTIKIVIEKLLKSVVVDS